MRAKPWRHLAVVASHPPEHVCNDPGCIHVAIPYGSTLRAEENRIETQTCASRRNTFTVHVNQLAALVRTLLTRPRLWRRNDRHVLLEVLADTLHRHCS